MKTVGHALHNVHAGDEKLASNKLIRGIGPTLEVSSREFGMNEPLPETASATGGSIPPSIAWRNVPASAKSVVVMVEDPDAPFPEPFVHWIAYGIRGADGTLSGSAPLEGKNSKLGKGFTGAAPPPGHGLHHYHFQVFALDTDVTLEPGAGRSALLAAMKDHIVAWGDLVGTYQVS